MTDAEQAELQEYRRQDLLRQMQTISEEHWAATWHTGLEHDLYLMTFYGVPADYGMGVIEPVRLERMKRLAQLSQVWWVYSEERRHPTTIPLAEAEQRFSKLVARDERGVEHSQSIPEVKRLYAAAAAGDWERETISALMEGLPNWQSYRLRTNPLLAVMRRVGGERDDWELRFGDTTVDYVRPSWAAYN